MYMGAFSALELLFRSWLIQARDIYLLGLLPVPCIRLICFCRLFVKNTRLEFLPI